MSAARRLFRSFSVVGSITGAAAQYKDGLSGKPMEWTDIGPQAIPKFLGRLHKGHNDLAQLQGQHANALHEARLKVQLAHDSAPTEFEMAERRVQRALSQL